MLAAAKLPASEQIGLDKASLDAITRDASGELAAEWEALSEELLAVQSNVSSSLARELEQAEAETLQRIRKTEANLRRNLVQPNRRSIRRELLAVRDTQEQNARRRGDQIGIRPARLRDDWWASKLRTSDPNLLRAAEWSALSAGALIIAAALDSTLGGVAPVAAVLRADAETRAAVVVLWRGAFAASIVVYLGAFLKLVLDTDSTDGDVEWR